MRCFSFGHPLDVFGKELETIWMKVKGVRFSCGVKQDKGVLKLELLNGVVKIRDATICSARMWPRIWANKRTRFAYGQRRSIRQCTSHQTTHVYNWSGCWFYVGGFRHRNGWIIAQYSDPDRLALAFIPHCAFEFLVTFHASFLIQTINNVKLHMLWI